MATRAPCFDFACGDKARINLNGIEGTVTGQYNDRNGAQYHVEYARNDGGIESRYFRADEVTAV